MKNLSRFFSCLLERSSLFHKILAVNAIILLLVAVVTTGSTLRLVLQPGRDFPVLTALISLGICVGVLANYLVLGAVFKRHAQAVSRQILEAVEDERKRISRELHDESGQSLTTLVILSEQLLAQLTEDQTEQTGLEVLRTQLEKLRDLALQTFSEVHKLMYDLRPTILDDLGFIPALRWYVNEKLKPLGFEVNLDVPENMERLPDHVETSLFRIIQEAVTNITKHAAATEIELTVRGDAKHIRAWVTDNGRGFDVDRVFEEGPKERGLGLFGMRERAELVGGCVHICSTPGAGTRVSVKVPRTGRKESS